MRKNKKLKEKQETLLGIPIVEVSDKELESGGIEIGSYFGGIASYWENESTQLLPSRPKFKKMKVKLCKLPVVLLDN